MTKGENYLSEEVAAFKELEEASFTEAQVTAIAHYIEFKLKWQTDWVCDHVKDEANNLRSEIRTHGHLDGGVVIPY